MLLKMIFHLIRNMNCLTSFFIFRKISNIFYDIYITESIMYNERIIQKKHLINIIKNLSEK